MAALLKEEKQIDEKVLETDTALAGIKKEISQSLVHPYLGAGDGSIPMVEDLMKREQAYERLLEALLDMKKEIRGRIGPLEERIVEANVENLKALFHEKTSLLLECVSAMDQKVLECRLHLDQYRQIHSELQQLSERLSRLGSDSLPLPDPLVESDIGDVIRQRIEQLKVQGKL